MLASTAPLGAAARLPQRRRSSAAAPLRLRRVAAAPPRASAAREPAPGSRPGSSAPPNWVFAGTGMHLVSVPVPLPTAAAPPADAPPPAGLARLSQADATGIVMGAALGLGAPLPGKDKDPAVPLSFSASRRRTQGVAFTCGRCGARTQRVVNPDALQTGTTFVQCSNEDCLVYHKLVDNLGLFHELKGPVYPAPAPRRPRSGGYDVLDLDADARRWH